MLTEFLEMPFNHFIIEKPEFIPDHRETFTLYFPAIKQPDDFTILPAGKKSFDEIISRLPAAGDNFEKIEKLHPGLTKEFISNDVERIIGFRDLAAPRYEKPGSAIIFEICRDQIHRLISSVKKFLNNY